MIDVSAGVIRFGGKILLTRRLPGGETGGMWEFPGGKLELLETAERCLVREILEELNIRIGPAEFLGTFQHKYQKIDVRLHAFLADYLSGELTLSAHDEAKWILPCDLLKHALAPADVPIAQKVCERFFA